MRVRPDLLAGVGSLVDDAEEVAVGVCEDPEVVLQVVGLGVAGRAEGE